MALADGASAEDSGIITEKTFLREISVVKHVQQTGTETPPAETFEFVAGLLRKGVNVSDTYRKVLQVKTKSAFELTRAANNRIEFFEDGKIAYTYVTLEDYEKFNAVAGDHEGIVDIGRDIEGVEVSIFIREIKGKGLKVSLRSNDKVNVDEIALLYGGGGHPKAAGFSINDDLESVKQRVIAEAKRYL